MAQPDCLDYSEHVLRIFWRLSQHSSFTQLLEMLAAPKESLLHPHPGPRLHRPSRGDHDASAAHRHLHRQAHRRQEVRPFPRCERVRGSPALRILALDRGGDEHRTVPGDSAPVFAPALRHQTQASGCRFDTLVVRDYRVVGHVQEIDSRGIHGFLDRWNLRPNRVHQLQAFNYSKEEEI